MKRAFALLLVCAACAGLLPRAQAVNLYAELESGYKEENQYGPFIGDVVANPGMQSWVRLVDRKEEPGEASNRIGTLEDGARLPCVGLMVNTGWYRVVARGQIAYVSYKYTRLDTSTHREPEVANPLDIRIASALSERPRSRWTDGAGNYYTYAARNMLDGDLTTAWTPGSGNKLIDDGIGQYADFRFQTPVTLEGVQVLNGYQRSTEAFEENSRPSILEISFQQEGSATFNDPLAFEMYDGLVGWQHLNFDARQRVTAFRLTVVDVYRGTKFDTDVGISEVRASGRE